MMPSARFLLCLTAWCVLGLAASLGWLPLAAWWGTGVGLLALAALDATSLVPGKGLEAARRLPAALALGHETEVVLSLQPMRRRPARAEVYDHHPGAWPAQGLPAAVTLLPGRETQIRYLLRPLQRGLMEFGQVGLRESSRFRLWMRRSLAGAGEGIRVYPNFAPLARFAIINAERATRIAGAHLQRRRGEGTEFHQLREFRIGDSLRQVDWKATARMRRPISREYQDERNQQIILMLDTGRRMLARDDELSHFDHVLDASLVLGYMALRQGDSLGLMTTGQEARWLPPQRGAGAINTVLNALYDLEARPVATDFLNAATVLAMRQRRRALVMLVSNLRDDDIDEVAPAVKLLMRRHLVCVASLRERALDEALARPVTNLEGALVASGSIQFLEARREAHQRLKRLGVPVLDVTCEALPGALTEAYLAIKRSGRL